MTTYGEHYQPSGSGSGGPAVTTGSTDPSSTPAAEGDIYVDTTADRVWMAKGTASSADWVRVGHDAAYTTITRTIHIILPEDTDEIHMGYWPHNAKFARILATTDTGAVNFKLNIRSKLAPDASTANYLNSSADQATQSGLDQTSFTIGEIAASAGEHLVYEATAVSTAQEVWITVEATLA